VKNSLKIFLKSLLIDSQEAEKYWEFIRWNPVSFLTLHDSYQTRLFYNKTHSNFFQDIVAFIKGTLGGMIRFVSLVIHSYLKKNSSKSNQNPHP